mmetsp:Transcript_43976/g.116253  ORF Transcript_43976/g.116253 Transcript_43976/m.116253 type:complete len:556 (-) Transcript_43976:92-1759(-)
MALPRWLILIVFCQLVQVFMSYDGGATPASIDKIQNSGIPWTQAELGLLGSLDKFGMTISSVLWGKLLQTVPAKVLLVMGLALNSASTLAFGDIEMKESMYAAKLLMGITQGLQCVWSTCWVLTRAPSEFRTVWLGLGAVSAGVGNGIGTAVAGFGTSQGLPYAFAWRVESAALGVLWLLLVLCPSEALAIDQRELDVADASPVGNDLDNEDTPQSNVQRCGLSGGSAFEEALFEFQKMRSLSGSFLSVHSESRRENVIRSADAFCEVSFCRTRAKTNYALDVAVVVEADGVLEQLGQLGRNKLYVWTVLALSAVMFVTSGIQFLWVRLFMQAWGIGKGVTITGFLVTSGLGGAAGVAIGPRAIDRCGGFMSNEGRIGSLHFIVGVMGAASCGAIISIGVLFLKWTTDSLGAPSSTHYMLLYAIWGALFVLFAGFNAALAGLTGINISAVSPPMRSLGSGCTVSVQNLLGYAMGPLLPGLIMDFLSSEGPQPPVGAPSGADDPRSRVLCCGMAFVLLGALAALWSCLAAWAVAKRAPQGKANTQALLNASTTSLL